MKFKGTIEVVEKRAVDVEFPLQGYVVEDRQGPLGGPGTVYGFFPTFFTQGLQGAEPALDRAKAFAATIEDTRVVWIGLPLPRKPGDVRVGDIWVWHTASGSDVRVRIRCRSAYGDGWTVDPIDKYPYDPGPNEWFTTPSFTDGTCTFLEGA